MSVHLYAADWSVRQVDDIIVMPNATDFKFGKHVSRTGWTYTQMGGITRVM